MPIAQIKDVYFKLKSLQNVRLGVQNRYPPLFRNSQKILSIAILSMFCCLCKASPAPSIWILRWEYTNRIILQPKGSGVEPDEVYDKSIRLPFSQPCFLFISFAARAPVASEAIDKPIDIQYELVRGTICNYAGMGVYCRELSPEEPVSVFQKHSIGPLSEIAGSFAADPSQGWRDASQDWSDYTSSGRLGIQVRRMDTNELLCTSEGKSLLAIPAND